MEHHYPELAPVSDESPAGTDVRYEADFEQLQAEIDKLSSPSASSSIDWQKVKSLASGILRTQSKDLLVASYLAAAEIRVNGLDGFQAGLQVFGGMLDTYWESLFPSKKRMRGRQAAVVWWLEKSEAALSEINVEPIDPGMAEELRKGVRVIDELLRQHLEEAPLLRPLERIIDEFPLQEAIEEVSTDAAAEEAKIEPPSPPPPQEQAAEQEVAHAVAEAPRVASAPEIGDIDAVSAAEVDKIIRGAFHTVRQSGDYYFAKDLANQRGYRFRRIAGWSMIQALPPANEGQTQIPPPGECDEAKRRFGEYRALGKWQELLNEAESKLPNALLWLDLNRYSAESLAGLGGQYGEAHEAVCQETSFLLIRLPGLEKLTFADGTPLADAETKQWIEQIRPDSEHTMQTPAPSMGQVDERRESVLEQAQNLAANRKLPEAVNLVMEEVKRSSGGQDRLLWRLGLSQLLISHRQAKLALPHLDEIVETIDAFNIEVWDPVLAAHALRVAWRGYRADKGARDRAEVLLARIARLDPAAALQLEK